jgi:beta-lactam-binding protein with PASTA domain
VLREAGFKTQVQPMGVNRKGIRYVVYTNPAASTEAPKGSTVILYVV